MSVYEPTFLYQHADKFCTTFVAGLCAWLLICRSVGKWEIWNSGFYCIPTGKNIIYVGMYLQKAVQFYCYFFWRLKKKSCLSDKFILFSEDWIKVDGTRGLRKFLSAELTCHKAAETTADSSHGGKLPYSRRKDGGQEKADRRLSCLKVDQD